MTGPDAAKSWRDGVRRDADIFDLKGLLASLSLGKLSFEPAEHPVLALAAAIILDGKQIGYAGQLWPAQAREFDATAPVVAAEIELPAPAATLGKYREIPRYPAVTRDMALVAPVGVRIMPASRKCYKS